jgi:hypothetical protein
MNESRPKLMMTYTRPHLEKLLVQDFGGCTWEAARRAVQRYLIEAETIRPEWYALYYGDPYAITEWIAGTARYWVPKNKRWKVEDESGNWRANWRSL